MMLWKIPLISDRGVMTVLLMTFIKYSETNIQPDRNCPASTTLVFDVALYPTYVNSLFVGILLLTIQSQRFSVAFFWFFGIAEVYICLF